MTLKLIEEAIDNVKDYLETNMAAKITVLNAEYDDSITLDNIDTWYVGEVSAMPQYPSIMVLGDSTEVEGEGADWLEGGHQISIFCFVTDANIENLRRRLYRYIRAIIELLKEARGSNGWAYIINFDRAEFAPVYSRGGTFLSDASLTIRTKRYESS